MAPTNRKIISPTQSILVSVETKYVQRFKDTGDSRKVTSYTQLANRQ